MKKILFSVFALFVATAIYAQTPSSPIPPLTQETAEKFAQMALSCIATEYPNKIAHTLNSGADVNSPQALHPSFYGCYDWHSSVHGHWLLVKMTQQFPALAKREDILNLLDNHFSVENMAQELAYFEADGRASFERPYGWGWFLKLTAELAQSPSERERQWHQNLSPLAQTIRNRYFTYLSGLHYPIRRGVHENTALGLSFAWDYAQTVKDSALAQLISERGRFYYLQNKNIPAAWEPEGDDFLSPSLIVADLMQRILTPDEFAEWFGLFLPEIPESLASPAKVTDRNDPKGVHLDGLNLSRAWCFFEIAKKLPTNNLRRQQLFDLACLHAQAALPHVLSDNYMGTHWLATFAIYMYLTVPSTTL